MLTKEWAKRFNRTGSDKIHYKIQKNIEELKKDGLIIAYNKDNDLMIFEGAFEQEIGCFEGNKLFIGLKENKNIFIIENSQLFAQKEFNVETIRKMQYVETRWCPKDDVDTVWVIYTDIPHNSFNIISAEDGKVFCRAIIFRMGDIDTIKLH
jgi:hypothetical protein